MSTKKRVNVLENFGNSVNCYSKKGKLTPGYSAVNVPGEHPDVVTFAKYSKMTEKYFICTPASLNVSTDGKNFPYYTNFDGSSPFLIEEYIDGSGCSIVISGRDSMLDSPEIGSKNKLPYSLNCGVLHCGRLFGGDGYTLRWSGSEDPRSWSEGLHSSGYLKLEPERGKILNLLVYGGKLVAVREYGLTVFSMHGAPENFSVSFTDTDCDCIYRNTACVVSGKIYFCSLSGLKSFNGTAISPLELKYAVSGAKSAVEYGGKYFLACKSEALKSNVILCVDADLESCIIDASADVLFVKDGVRFFNSNGQYILERGGEYKFVSSVIDFGTDRMKTITELKVKGKATISIMTERLINVYKVKDGTARPHMRGKHFTVIAEGSEDVSEISITAEVMNAI